jgi:membrane fusion protein (multidrug efflux system)
MSNVEAAAVEPSERKVAEGLTPPSREPKPQQEAKASPEDKPKEDKPKDGDKAEKDAAPKPKVSFWRRRPLLTLGAILLLAVAGVAGYIYYDHTSHFQTTDDAFIAARQTALAPKVTGYVKAVPVTDNQHVNAGDIIAKLDDRDYQVALDSANAQVDQAKAGVSSAQASREVQDAQIESAKAQLAQANAALVFAQQQASRFTDLAQKGAGTVANAEQYSSQLGQQKAAVKSAEAAVTVAERQVQSIVAQLATSQANLGIAVAQRDSALLNLSYTIVRAEEPGRVVQLSATHGELAQPGTDLTMFVPDAIWIVANFKETQLTLMRPGQPVEVDVDAYPNRVFKGHVDSIQPGSGTAFSLLPVQNATGNYVKVVQRVPVKIVFDEKPDDVVLGPGMSLEPTVRVDPSPSLWERMSGGVNNYWKTR